MIPSVVMVVMPVICHCVADRCAAGRSRRRVIFDSAPPDPLPLVLDEAPDESLSSWLNRHAQFNGIAPSAFCRRVGIDRLTLSRIDHRLTTGAARTLANAMRRSPTEIASMTHQQLQDRLAPMIARGEAAQVCSVFAIPGFVPDMLKRIRRWNDLTTFHILQAATADRTSDPPTVAPAFQDDRHPLVAAMPPLASNGGCH